MVKNFLFHSQFNRIGELEAIRAEELDAVVLPGIVRGVGTTPALSTSTPVSRNPAASVAAIQGPESRVSRPSRTRGRLPGTELRSEWPRARPTA